MLRKSVGMVHFVTINKLKRKLCCSCCCSCVNKAFRWNERCKNRHLLHQKKKIRLNSAYYESNYKLLFNRAFFILLFVMLNVITYPTVCEFWWKIFWFNQKESFIYDSKMYCVLHPNWSEHKIVSNFNLITFIQCAISHTIQKKQLSLISFISWSSIRQTGCCISSYRIVRWA